MNYCSVRYNAYFRIELRFASDYTEDALITLPNNKDLIIDGNGHNVSFNNIVRGYSAHCAFRELTFNKELNASECSYFVLDRRPSVFNVSSGAYGLVSRYNSYVLVSQPLTMTGDNASQMVRCINNSRIGLNTKSITVNGTGNLFIYLTSNSNLWLGSELSFTQTDAVFQKYYIQKDCSFITNQRGDIFPSSMTEGQIDNTSIVI